MSFKPNQFPLAFHAGGKLFCSESSSLDQYLNIPIATEYCGCYRLKIPLFHKFGFMPHHRSEFINDQIFSHVENLMSRSMVRFRSGAMKATFDSAGSTTLPATVIHPRVHVPAIGHLACLLRFPPLFISRGSSTLAAATRQFHAISTRIFSFVKRHVGTTVRILQFGF